MSPASSSAAPRRLLLRGVNWLGDAVMTTPALQRLREHFPDTRLTLLTAEKLAEIWAHYPNLDAVLTFAPGESPWSVARRLRGEAFDAALLLPNSPRTALEVWLARIPRRIGYSRPWRDWWLTQTVGLPPGYAPMRKLSTKAVRRLADRLGARPSEPGSGPTMHHLQLYLHLAAALGASSEPVAPRLVVQDGEMRTAAARFGMDGKLLGQRPLLALNPGAEYGPAKRWPADRFIAAARAVQTRTQCVWLILGGKTDVPVARAIAAALRQPDSGPGSAGVLEVSGQTSLRELMALLKLCRVLLTNDSGPMHLAAALGTPVVVPFGSTSPELTGPGLPGDPRHHLLRANAPCSPCFRRECPIDFRCMTAITVDLAVAAVLRALA